MKRFWSAALLVFVATVANAGTANAQQKPPLALKVVGNRILDAKNAPVRLRGVNAASLEWSTNGEGHILDTVKVAIDDWKANIVRVPLSQDRWFGKAPEQKDDGKAYRALVRQVVDTIAGRGAYAILDLHWSNTGEWGTRIGQHNLPDINSVAFWKDVAGVYKNNPAVLFDLYNEPHDVSWDVWRDGGSVTERDRRAGTETTYDGVGMRKLLETVRGTGAKNVVVVGGLDWAYRFDGILEKPLADPKGNGIIYANHAYPFKGETVDKWIARMETSTAKFPVIVSEFGSDPTGGAGKTGAEWVDAVIAAIDGHQWSYTAWDLHPAAGPTLISDWNYTPTSHFGVAVKKALGNAK